MASESQPTLSEVALGAVQGLQDKIDLHGRVDRSPFGTVAAAAGVGYVLGGGLFSPLTARALGLGLRLGLRLVVLPMVSQQIAGLAQGLVDGHPAESATEDSAAA